MTEIGKAQFAYFSERLKAVRKIRGITQAELEKISGIRTSSIAQMETGKRIPSFQNLKKLCESLKISADYLLGLTECPFAVQGQDADAGKLMSRLSKRDYDTVMNLLLFFSKEEEQ